jgi:hypothetical protein
MLVKISFLILQRATNKKSFNSSAIEFRAQHFIRDYYEHLIQKPSSMKQLLGLKNSLAAAILCALFASCNAQDSENKFPAGYDLSKPEIIKVAKEVNQISGIAYYENDNAVFAIDDDHGNLYKISLEKDPKVEKWEFGKDNDYEDLALVKDSFYILSSYGKIVSFPFSFPITSIKETDLDLSGKNEFEILYFDKAANRLIMMCKDCADDKGENSAYAFDLKTNAFILNPVLHLKKKDIEEKLAKQISKFKPSGASMNPLTGEVFIISSVNKLLVITDANMQVKEVYELDPALFKQPEGICFTPKGDLLISNESAKEGKADILRFVYEK